MECQKHKVYRNSYFTPTKCQWPCITALRTLWDARVYQVFWRILMNLLSLNVILDNRTCAKEEIYAGPEYHRRTNLYSSCKSDNTQDVGNIIFWIKKTYILECKNMASSRKMNWIIMKSIKWPQQSEMFLGMSRS